MTDSASHPAVDLERFRALVDDARAAWVVMRDVEAAWHDLRVERDRAAVAARAPREAAITAVCRAARSFDGYSRLATEADTARLFAELDRILDAIPTGVDRERVAIARRALREARPLIEEADDLDAEERRVYAQTTDARARVTRTGALRERVATYLTTEAGVDRAVVEEITEGRSRRRPRSNDAATVRVPGAHEANAARAAKARS